MKYYLVLEVKEPTFFGMPVGEKRLKVHPAESLGFEEYGWFHPSRLIEAEKMIENYYPDRDEKHIIFFGVRQPEPEKDEWEKWIEEYPGTGIVEPAQGAFKAWLRRMPKREKAAMQQWIDEEPDPSEERFWSVGEKKFNLQNYETARLAWFAKMPGREG